MTELVTIRRATTSTRVGGGLLALGVVALAMLPYVIVPSQVFRFIDLLVFVVLATMWNLLAGYGGMVSVGQQAYIGIGAYGLVYLADQLGVDAFLAVPLVAVVAAAVAIPVSFLAFRLVGGYFAIGTWVIAEVVRLLTVQVDDLGAGAGTSLRSLSDIDRDLRIAYTYWFALGLATVAVVATYLLIRSRLGIALTAIRDEPTAAASNGVEVTRVKRIVFVVSAAGCGAAGAILALSSLGVQPDSIYSVQWTAYMIFMVIIGGVGTLEGPIVGAVLFYVLREWLAQFGVIYLVVLGAVAIAITLFVPQGLWGAVSRGRLRLFAVGHTVRLPAEPSPTPPARRT
ncbi:MAG TPA: branched-chain amino acid ABC transporter permease [Actinophytocola sp.]|jgi:branched-chain amino acid transport system permease protein|uniref:branched-chain amino acid ABC transporter permease n=1 Tax=Actinophytocola sp. TaxID=1872138 RepID=UPI002F95E49C